MLTFALLALYQKEVENRVLDRYGITWYGYRILCAIHKFDEQQWYVTTSQVHELLGSNRGWVDREIYKLESKGLLEIKKSKNPWVARRLSNTGKGHYCVAAVERFIKRKVETQ